MEQQKSLFDQVISKPRPWGFFLGVAGLLFLSLFIAVLLDSNLEDFSSDFSWRGLLIPGTIILYILGVAPRMAHMEKRVLQSFQSILYLDEAEFEETINQSAKSSPRKELAAIGIGLVLSIFAATGSMGGELTWVTGYWVITTIAMYTLLVWTIYVSIAGTRVIKNLLQQPLKIDPFDTTAFEPIGRQSLMISLVFVGGITLSLVFIGWDFSSFRQPVFWLVYIPLGLVPLILFFLNMLPTHRVLADAKAKELAAVRGQLQNACRKLLRKLENSQDTNNTPNEISALAVYEKQLKETRTWPYNTAMLRTLFFSVLIPVGTLVGRIIVEAISN